jgi:chorismate mutase
MTVLTEFMSAATSAIIGSSEGARSDDRRWIVAVMSGAMWRYRATKARLRSCVRGDATRKDGATQANKRRDVTDETLSRYRQSIDNIDAALVFMLAERFKITQAVGRYKAETGMPPADPGREERQIDRLRRLAQDADLDPEFSEKFLRFIIDEVIRHHERLRDVG